MILIPLLVLLPGCTQTQPLVPSPHEGGDGIGWGACSELEGQLERFAEVTGEPSPLEGWADRMECGELQVPLDHSAPEGRQITLAISRLLPERESAGVVLTNPGGPGLEGRTFPAVLAASRMAGLAVDRTIVGVDVRGTGGSTSLECDALLELQAPEGEVDEAGVLAYARDIAAANGSCVAEDRQLAANLTVQDAARDLDQVRAALGVDTVDYLGTSWGTELGVAYLTQFPQKVGRMLLDSVTDLRHEADLTLDDIAAAVASRETTAGARTPVAPEGLASSTLFRPVNIAGRTAMTCNAYAGATDPAQTRSAHLARAERFGLDPDARIQHPLTADLAGSSTCTGWPIPPRPLLPQAVDHEALQIVAHATETVTPAVWGEEAHALLGGRLTVLPDGDHASVPRTDAGQSAVDFLRTGRPMR